MLLDGLPMDAQQCCDLLRCLAIDCEAQDSDLVLRQALSLRHDAQLGCCELEELEIRDDRSLLFRPDPIRIFLIHARPETEAKSGADASWQNGHCVGNAGDQAQFAQSQVHFLFPLAHDARKVTLPVDTPADGPCIIQRPADCVAVGTAPLLHKQLIGFLPEAREPRYSETIVEGCMVGLRFAGV